MLAKSKRLNLKKSFKWVSSGKSFQSEFFKVMYRAGDNSSPLVGIALSKGNFKKAHDRNRARRLSSRAVEELYSLLPKGGNLVIMPKAGVLLSDGERLFKDLKRIVERVE